MDSEQSKTPLERARALRSTVHDLKNALTPVLANARVMQMRISPDAGVDEELVDILEGAIRASDIAARLSQLARGLEADLGGAE